MTMLQKPYMSFCLAHEVISSDLSFYKFHTKNTYLTLYKIFCKPLLNGRWTQKCI